MIKLFNAIFLAGGQLRIDKDICYADAQYALAAIPLFSQCFDPHSNNSIINRALRRF